jgi:cell fate regulator YaaT (PSP1 superfamily)
VARWQGVFARRVGESCFLPSYTWLKETIMQFYFVRIGSWGEVTRCRTAGGGTYRRGTRVICRTPRGLEVGQITAGETAEEPAGEEASEPAASAVTILRATTPEDELLLARLERHRCDAMEECRQCLAAAGSSAVLLEVDQVFDCGTLVFYFLSPPQPRDEQLVQQLAERYESRVRSAHFAKLLATGCGPGCGEKDCGTETAGEASNGKRGCSGSCAVCVVAGAARR